MTGLRGKPGFHSQCPTCGKRSFVSRALAKRMAKDIDPTLRVYRCKLDPGQPWHMGHLAPDVINGTIDRRTAYGAREEEDDV